GGQPALLVNEGHAVAKLPVSGAFDEPETQRHARLPGLRPHADDLGTVRGNRAGLRLRCLGIAAQAQLGKDEHPGAQARRLAGLRPHAFEVSVNVPRQGRELSAGNDGFHSWTSPPAFRGRQVSVPTEPSGSTRHTSNRTLPAWTAAAMALWNPDSADPPCFTSSRTISSDSSRACASRTPVYPLNTT